MLALCVAGACVTAPAAWAAPAQSASASFSNLTYRLIDLDPNDGVAASVSFTGQGSASTNYEAAYVDVSGLPLTPLLQQGTGASASITASGIAASASVESGAVSMYIEPANPGQAFFTLSGGGTASAVLGDTTLGYEPVSTLFLALGANTGIVFEMRAQGEATINAADLKAAQDSLLTNEGFDLDTMQFSYGQLYSSFLLQAALYTRDVIDNDQGQMGAIRGSAFSFEDYLTDVIDGETALATSFDRIITLDYFNATSQSVQASLAMETRTNATASVGGMVGADLIPVPSIPEPGTYALMGLGLVGLAWARRRHQAA